jgi:hypothetical protein
VGGIESSARRGMSSILKENALTSPFLPQRP